MTCWLGARKAARVREGAAAGRGTKCTRPDRGRGSCAPRALPWRPPRRGDDASNAAEPKGRAVLNGAQQLDRNAAASSASAAHQTPRALATDPATVRAGCNHGDLRLAAAPPRAVGLRVRSVGAAPSFVFAFVFAFYFAFVVVHVRRCTSDPADPDALFTGRERAADTGEQPREHTYSEANQRRGLAGAKSVPGQVCRGG